VVRDDIEKVLDSARLVIGEVVDPADSVDLDSLATPRRKSGSARRWFQVGRFQTARRRRRKSHRAASIMSTPRPYTIPARSTTGIIGL
jgi:hypothetical protein